MAPFYFGVAYRNNITPNGMDRRLLRSLRHQWQIADSLKVEIGGIIRGNVAFAITTGTEREVIPDCTVEFRFETFHTHPFKQWKTDRSYISETGMVEFPSGPDVSQLLGCNDETTPITRTEYIVGQNGVVRVRTTEGLIQFYSTLNVKEKRLLERCVEQYAWILNTLVQINLFSGAKYTRRLRHLQFDNLDETIRKILADPNIKGKDILMENIWLFANDRFKNMFALFPKDIDGFEVTQGQFQD